MALTAVIDRIEGELAVIELGDATLHVPLADLPEGSAEGSRLSLRFDLLPPTDQDEAQARLQRMRARGPQGRDIDL